MKTSKVLLFGLATLSILGLSGCYIYQPDGYGPARVGVGVGVALPLPIVVVDGRDRYYRDHYYYDDRDRGYWEHRH